MPNDEPLLSKLFFLDTQTYMARNFQFDVGVLGRLQEHLEVDDCHLLITDVNVREIQRHLQRKSLEAVEVIGHAKKEAMILRNLPGSPWHGIFEKITSDEVFSKLNEKFSAFLDNPRVEVVKTSTVSVEAVFDAYFNEKPPFATSGKKSEFPDAFVLLAVEAISKHRGYKLYVVSEDRDVKSFCAGHENLISVGRLEELLDLVLKNSALLAEPAKFAEETYKKFEKAIHLDIQKKLDNAEFEMEIDDTYPEAEVVSFNTEKVDYLGTNLMEVSAQHAVFEVSVRLTAVVDLSFPDYDRSPWDPEDKEYPFVLHNRLANRYVTTGAATVSFKFDDGLAANAEIDWIDVESLLDFSHAKVEQISYRELDLSDDE
jgi:hypothetical protein